jgi:hypothetical protein
MQVIVRKERPHPGAQLRFTDLGGHRFTCFATDARCGQLADLELRHRRRARCEDRIRNAKDSGLRNLPLHGFAQSQLWCELVAMAWEPTAWMQMLALDGPARAWEPKRLRLRCSLLPAASSAAATACVCAWPRPGPGPPSSPLRSPACRPARLADHHQTTPSNQRRTASARGTPPTRRDSRAVRHGQALKISKRPLPQPDSSLIFRGYAAGVSQARRMALISAGVGCSA